MVRQRLIFGALMGLGFIGLLLADAWLDDHGQLPGRAHGLLFATLVALLVLGGSRELFRMARAKGLDPLDKTGTFVAIGLAVSPFIQDLHPWLGRFPVPAFAVAFGVMLIFLVQAATRRTHNAIPNTAATLLAVGYLGGLALFVVLIRMKFDTWGLLAYLLAVKFTDIGAWATGMTLGKHKMIPWLSPGKSWEGMAGGAVAAVVVSVVFTLVSDSLGHALMGWRQAIVFGLILAPAGQCGDLAESLLKRDAGVKDSGQTIPGFGGLLDVLDSPLGAAPLGYLLLLLLHAAGR